MYSQIKENLKGKGAGYLIVFCVFITIIILISIPKAIIKYLGSKVIVLFYFLKMKYFKIKAKMYGG